MDEVQVELRAKVTRKRGQFLEDSTRLDRSLQAAALSLTPPLFSLTPSLSSLTSLQAGDAAHEQHRGRARMVWYINERKSSASGT
jgi:hypothetical protein